MFDIIKVMIAKAKISVFGLFLVGEAAFIFLVFLMGGFFITPFLAYAAPEAPTLNSVTTQSACRVELNWSQNTKADSFNLRYKEGNKPFSGAEIFDGSCAAASAPCNNKTEKYSGLTPQKNYSFQLKACDAVVGCSNVWSDPKTAMTTSITQPTAPTNLKVEWDDGSRLNLSWQADAAVTGGRRIYKSSDALFGNGNDVGVGVWPFNQPLPFMDLSFNPDVTNYLAVKAYNADVGCDTGDITATSDGVAAFSGFSSTVIVPPRTGSVTAAVAQSGDAWNLTVSWSNVTDETGYQVQLASNANFQTIIHSNTVNADITSYITPLSSGLTVYYRVRAFNTSNGNEGNAEWLTGVGPISTGMKALSNFAVSVVYASYVGATPAADLYFSWQDNEPALHKVVIEESLNGVTFSDFVIVQGAQGKNPPQFYNIPGDGDKALSGKYYYRAKTVNLSNSLVSSSYSAVYEVNLNIYRILRGTAWAMVATSTIPATTTLAQNGIGWTSFNKMDLDDACDVTKHASEPGWVEPSWCVSWRTNPIKYSVQIDDAGVISGAGWASTKDEKGWGWLSFNKGDLVGCELLTGVTGQTAADCAAKIVNLNSCRGGSVDCEIRGWGRFIAAAANPTQNWDGWTRLSSKKVSDPIVYVDRNMLALWENWVDLKSSLRPENFALASVVDNFWQVAKSWVKIFRAQATSHISHSIFYQPLNKKVSGVGWGGAIIGWVAMGNDTGNPSKPCPECNVRSVNRKPTISNVMLEEGVLGSTRTGEIWCALEPEYVVKFDYSDPDGDAPGQVMVKFYKMDNTLSLSTTTNWASKNKWRTDITEEYKFDTLLNCSDVDSPIDYRNGASCELKIKDPLGLEGTSGEEGYNGGYLVLDTDYYVKLNAADGIGGESFWAVEEKDMVQSSNQKKTPTHYYPFVGFSWEPDGKGEPAPSAGQIVQFTDGTLAGPNAPADTNPANDYPPVSWLWTFTNGNSTSRTAQNTNAIFTIATPWKAKLEATDSDTHICSFEQTLLSAGGDVGTASALKRRIFRER